MEKTTINQRIQLLIDELGMKKNSFAVKIGVTATTVGNVVRDITKPSFDVIEKILDTFPTVSEKWLVRGLGPMFINSEPSLVGKIEIDDYLKTYLEKLEETFSKAITQRDHAIDHRDKVIRDQNVIIDYMQSQLGKLCVNEKESAVLQMEPTNPVTMQIAA